MIKIKEDILNDIEKEKVMAFCKDEVMREAVKKVLLAEIYENGVLKPGEKTNPLRNTFQGIGMWQVPAEEIGQRVMALSEALNFLEGGFKKLESYLVTMEKVVDKKNPAR